jgi:replicative DNA helicase
MSGSLGWPADKPLPQNPDAERAVLAAPMLDPSPNCLLAISQQLSSEHFFDTRHKKIFRAELFLAAQQQAVDLVTVTDLLHRQGELGAAGGAAYIASLIDDIPRIRNVAHYAAIVRDAAGRRAVIYVCDELQKAASAGEDSPHKLQESGAHQFIEMLSKDGRAGLPHPWPDAVMSAMEEITTSFRDPGSVMRLNFGIGELDEATSGLRRQDLVLIVGQTSHGKTALAMQLATNADSCGYRGLIFSAEMSKEALAKRELAHTAKLPLWYTRRPEVIRDRDRALRELTEAAAQEAKRKLMVVDHDITPLRVKAFSELVQRTSGLDFVVVDYDQLVVRAEPGRHDDEYARQAQFVSDSLAMAKRLNICFVLLCQPRKVDSDVARGKRNPRVEEIFGHSAVGNTAHHILWVMRRFFQHDMDSDYECDAVVHVLKARNDKPASLEVDFDPNAVLFANKGTVERPAPSAR